MNTRVWVGTLAPGSFILALVRVLQGNGTNMRYVYWHLLVHINLPAYPAFLRFTNYWGFIIKNWLT